MQIECKLGTNEAQLYSVAEKNIFRSVHNKRRTAHACSNQKWLSEGPRALYQKQRNVCMLHSRLILL